MCSAFYKVKTFSICEEKITHLSNVLPKLLKTLFSWFQLGFYFSISLLKIPGKGTVLSIDFISFLCGYCWWKTSFFCGPSTWIYVFIKPSLYGGILVTKISEICLFLYMFKNGALLVQFFVVQNFMNFLRSTKIFTCKRKSLFS